MASPPGLRFLVPRASDKSPSREIKAAARRLPVDGFSASAKSRGAPYAGQRVRATVAAIRRSNLGRARKSGADRSTAPFVRQASDGGWRIPHTAGNGTPRRNLMLRVASCISTSETAVSIPMCAART
jgi:hypothetical protein